MEVIGFILMAVGMLVALIGGTWFFVVAFRESVLWGLGCIFVPFVSLIFLIMHWDEAGKPFLIKLAGIVPMVAGAAMTGLYG